MLKKDDQVTIEIEDIGTDGAGIGKADGYIKKVMKVNQQIRLCKEY